MSKKNNGLKVGDSVKVKKGIMCPGYETLCLEHFQGRVTDFGEDEGKETVCIEWDSISLKNLPEGYISQSFEEGLDYELMYLLIDEVELTKPRDTEKKVKEVQEEINNEYRWTGNDPEDFIIRKVLKNVDSEHWSAVYDAWENYLNETFSFPFDAKIYDGEYFNNFKMGDKVSIKSFCLTDDLAGLIVDVYKNRNKFALPLCDLEAVDKKSVNYLPLKAYSVWFANQ